MSVSICAFADEAAPAGRLAAALGLPLDLIELHRFPDGESLPTTPKAQVVLLYRSMDHPDDKIMPLLLACDALRRAGTRRLVLVAPYLCYMRQDTVFAIGQPLSRDVIARLFGERFDRVVTVEPHLHRTADIAAVFKTEVTVLSASRALAEALRRTPAPAVLIGPDAESEPWTAALAAELDAPHRTFLKVRRGDQSVELTLPDVTSIAGRRAVLVDDICSSGATLMASARALVGAGAATVEAAVVHALYHRQAAQGMKEAGILRVISTDSCAHSSNAAPLANILASALAGELAP